jgi:hypothetical protein
MRANQPPSAIWVMLANDRITHDPASSADAAEGRAKTFEIKGIETSS